MTYKTSIVYAWSIFLSILLIELLIDYFIRIQSNDFRYSGIPEPIWFFVHIAAAGISGYFIIIGLKYLNSTRYKITHIIVNLIIGSLLYLVTIGSYILGLGIDSL